MNSIPNKSTKQTIKNYLLQYHQIFKKRSFEIFYWLVLAILATEEIRSIKFLYDHFIKKFTDKALNSFYYFLSYVHFPIEELMKVTVSIALDLIPDDLKNTTIFLSIDDTLQPKFGKHFDCYTKMFDHTNRTGNSYLNGHCFVSLVINIPLKHQGNIKYLSLPIGYRLHAKDKSKLEAASELIEAVMLLLENHQVILLCHSWYSKGPVLNVVKAYKNLNLIGAIRCDTALFDLPPAPSGKRGRPKLKGERLDVKSFSYEKVGKYYMSTKKVMTRLFKTPVFITVTVKDIEQFSSVRLYISTINPEDIKLFNNSKPVETKYDLTKPQQQILSCYSIRWNIEVIFYQHKFFWSFGNYMVRNKEAIERYVNLLGIAYTFVMVLPFISKRYEKYQFESPQLIKRLVGEQLSKELIFDSFASTLESSKIYSPITEAINRFLDKQSAA